MLEINGKIKNKIKGRNNVELISSSFSNVTGTVFQLRRKLDTNDIRDIKIEDTITYHIGWNLGNQTNFTNGIFFLNGTTAVYF
jgi:ABC-type glucose/galactose transport system permease subunit